jgi:hypothetical protein
MTEPKVFQRNISILLKINSTNVNSTHIIYQPINVPTQLNPIDPVFNGFIQDLRIKIDINSLDEVGLPVLEPELTEAEKLQLYTQLEWANARMELSILKSLNGSDWIEISRLSLQNRAPYYSVDLLPYFTKQADSIVGNEWIAVKVINAGHGLLTGSDELVVYGSCQLQAHHYGAADAALPVPATSANHFNLDVTATSQLLVAANPNRKGFVAVNTSTGRVFLGHGIDAKPFNGVSIDGRGASYTVDYSMLWLGDIYAVTNSTTIQKLSCVEFT